MKLYVEYENTMYEVTKAKSLSEGDVVLFSNAMMRAEAIERMEKELSYKLDRKVVILDSKFRDILTLPPKKPVKTK